MNITTQTNIVSVENKLSFDHRQERDHVTKDTVDDEEAEVEEQQNGEDEGRTVQDVPGAFLLLNAPAAPGRRHSQSESMFQILTVTVCSI